MSINLTDKLDEAIAAIKEEEAIKQKNFRSAIAKECWATSPKLQAKMSNETAQRYGIKRNDIEQDITTTEVKPGWQSPNALWRSKKLTIRQINCLDKLEYTGPIPKLRGEASDIISKIINKSKVSDSRKITARKFFAMTFDDDSVSCMTIDESSDYDFDDQPSLADRIKLERQLWRESL
jgi:hypothetical protein